MMEFATREQLEALSLEELQALQDSWRQWDHDNRVTRAAAQIAQELGERHTGDGVTTDIYEDEHGLRVRYSSWGGGEASVHWHGSRVYDTSRAIVIPGPWWDAMCDLAPLVNAVREERRRAAEAAERQQLIDAMLVEVQ